MISAPPTSTHRTQPSKSRCAASSVWPPSMNKSRNGVRQPRATVVDRPTTATTWSSTPAASRVWRSVGSVSNSPVTGSTIDSSWYSQPAWCSSEPWWWSIGVDDPAGLLGRGAEHHRRLAAVRTDLDAYAVPQVADGGVVQRATLVGGHESDHLIGKCEQARGGLGAGRYSVVCSWGPTYRCWSMAVVVASGHVSDHGAGVDSAPSDRQAGRYRRSSGQGRGRTPLPRWFRRSDRASRGGRRPASEPPPPTPTSRPRSTWSPRCSGAGSSLHRPRYTIPVTRPRESSRCCATSHC